MSASAQYAASVQLGMATVITAEASRTAPTSPSFLCGGGALGRRIDRISMCAHGATIASVVRLFKVKGYVGPTITSITFSGTTATATTSSANGLSTGFKISTEGMLPFDYNVDDTAITVTGATTFTFSLATTPAANAFVFGSMIYTQATPTIKLLSETLVTAITPSATVAAWRSDFANTHPNLLPLLLPAGWLMKATVNDTQTSSGINVFAFGGNF